MEDQTDDGGMFVEGDASQSDEHFTELMRRKQAAQFDEIHSGLDPFSSSSSSNDSNNSDSDASCSDSSCSSCNRNSPPKFYYRVLLPGGAMTFAPEASLSPYNWEIPYGEDEEQCAWKATDHVRQLWDSMQPMGKYYFKGLATDLSVADGRSVNMSAVPRKELLLRYPDDTHYLAEPLRSTSSTSTSTISTSTTSTSDDDELRATKDSRYCAAAEKDLEIIKAKAKNSAAATPKRTHFSNSSAYYRFDAYEADEEDGYEAEEDH